MLDRLRLAPRPPLRDPGPTTGRTHAARRLDAVPAPPHRRSPARTTPETETVR